MSQKVKFICMSEARIPLIRDLERCICGTFIFWQIKCRPRCLASSCKAISTRVCEAPVTVRSLPCHAGRNSPGQLRDSCARGASSFGYVLSGTRAMGVCGGTSPILEFFEFLLKAI